MTETTLQPRLDTHALSNMSVLRRDYDRGALERRILHIGPGAFFRAHQADYFDRLNVVDPGWGIVGLSLRSPVVADALTPQDGLYTLVTLDREIKLQVIQSLLEVRHANQPDALSVFAAPELRLITLTITEKGYCLASDGRLDTTHPDIIADIASPQAPQSAIGWLVAGLRLRRDHGLAAPIILSCDNLPGNGRKLRAAVLGLASATDPKLASWIAAQCSFPSCMVDSITPASDDALRSRVAAETDAWDAWPIQREAYTEWVIEDVGDGRMPRLDRVGAVFTDAVDGYEQAKLRLLNGPHSTLAYFGLAHGCQSVAEAMANPFLAGFIAQLMRDEIAPSLEAPEGLDLDRYQAALLDRFANPAIVHRLSQIASDGSKKLPIRLLATIHDNLAAGRPIDRLCVGVAAWWRFVIRQTRAGAPQVDPLAERLQALAQQVRDAADTDTIILLSLNEVFEDTLVASAQFRAALVSGHETVLAVEREPLGGQTCS